MSKLFGNLFSPPQKNDELSNELIRAVNRQKRASSNLSKCIDDLLEEQNRLSHRRYPNAFPQTRNS